MAACSKIPPYDDAHILDFLRGREGVLRRIIRMYGFCQADITLSESQNKTLQKEIDTFLYSPAWKKRCSECAQFSKIEMDPMLQAQIDVATRQILNEYATAFFIRNKVEAQKSSQHNAKSGELILDIYTNHTSKEALSLIKSLGFNDRSTLSLTGFMIRGAVSHCMHIPFTSSAIIRPLLDGKILTDSTAAWRIEQIYAFQQRQAMLLAKNVKISR